MLGPIFMGVSLCDYVIHGCSRTEISKRQTIMQATVHASFELLSDLDGLPMENPSKSESNSNKWFYTTKA